MNTLQKNKFELDQYLQKNNNTDLETFLQSNQLTQYHFIQIVCHEKIKSLKTKYNNADVLDMKSTAEALGISYIHLLRLKQQGHSIPYTQNGERHPVYFPVWAIAVSNYLKSHPLIPGKITFSNLLNEIINV